MLWLEIPAYAGSTRTSATPTGTAPDHPRIRGEHGSGQDGKRCGVGSSPHTRGARPSACRSCRRRGIIPAYAGSTRRGSPRRRSPADHPRIRGEHCTLVHDAFKNTGSSPHTRGARPLPDRSQARQRIIPAYAGSTTGSAAPGISAEDHPRIRGEHCCENPGTQTVSGSSPHTRGAPLSSRRISSAIRIIPAYAGSTRQILWTARRWPDHPRIRGEHVSHFVRALVASGSSPHTRGAHARAVMPDRKLRIIPAYAGSTP